MKQNEEWKKKKQSNETHIFMCTLLLCVYTPILYLFIGRSAFFILFTLLTRSWTAERVCVVCLCVFGWCSFMPLFHCIKCYYCLRSWMHLWSSSENNEQELYTRRRWRNDTKQALHAPFLPYLFAAHSAQCIQTHKYAHIRRPTRAYTFTYYLTHCMQRVTLCMLWVKMIHIFFSHSGFGNDRPQAATLFFAMCILCICSAFPSSSPPAIFDGDSVVTIPFCTKKNAHRTHWICAHGLTGQLRLPFVRSFVHVIVLPVWYSCSFSLSLSLSSAAYEMQSSQCAIAAPFVQVHEVHWWEPGCKYTTGANVRCTCNCESRVIEVVFFFVTLAKGILPWNDGHFEHIEWCVCACGISVFRFGPAHRSHHHCCWQLLYSGFFGTEWNTREYIYICCAIALAFGYMALAHNFTLHTHCTTAHAIRTTCFTFTHTKRNTLETIYEAQARQTPNIKT